MLGATVVSASRTPAQASARAVTGLIVGVYGAGTALTERGARRMIVREWRNRGF
jgi:hypothetical protein